MLEALEKLVSLLPPPADPVGAKGGTGPSSRPTWAFRCLKITRNSFRCMVQAQFRA